MYKGVFREFVTSHWSIPYHEAIMCQSNTLIVIRLLPHFRNSVQEKDRHDVFPKIRFSI